MKQVHLILVSTGIACLSCCPLPADEASVIEFFIARGDSVTVDVHGHAVRLMARGTPPLSVQQLQQSGLPLTHLIIENANTFSGEDLAVLATLKTLKHLQVYTAKGSQTSEGEYRVLLVEFQRLRPEVTVSYVNR